MLRTITTLIPEFGELKSLPKLRVLTIPNRKATVIWNKIFGFWAKKKTCVYINIFS